MTNQHGCILCEQPILNRKWDAGERAHSACIAHESVLIEAKLARRNYYYQVDDFMLTLACLAPGSNPLGEVAAFWAKVSRTLDAAQQAALGKHRLKGWEIFAIIPYLEQGDRITYRVKMARKAGRKKRGKQGAARTQEAAA